MKKLNLNDYVKVKLTPEGVNIYYHQFDDLCDLKPNFKRILPSIDEDGFTKIQLWRLMEIYGANIYTSNAFEEIYIFIDDDCLEEVK